MCCLIQHCCCQGLVVLSGKECQYFASYRVPSRKKWFLIMHLLKNRAVFLRKSVAPWALLALAAAVHAPASAEPLRNVVQLSASGSVEVAQDWLQLTLSVTREGSEAAAVQRQLQQIVERSMTSLRSQARAQDMQVRSGSFGVYPRHGNDGKIKGWQGSAEVVLEGKDFARITQSAAQQEGMAIAHLGFGLSKEGRAQVQEQAQAQAIAQFKQRASQLAQQFGFASYSLREVQVNSHDGDSMPRMQRPAMLAASAKMEMADAVAVEAGKEQVTVNVSGSVQLQ